MNLARALARLATAARRPLRRPPWLRLVAFEAAPAPKPIGPASSWSPPSPEDHFEEKWDEYPALKASSAAWMKRKVMDKATFEKLSDALKARSFTAARVSTQKGLYDTLVSLQHGISEGLTVVEWREKYWDAIQRKYGKPGGTAPWYTLTVFRTNQQAAFAVGRYAEMFSEEATAEQPWVRYSAILDARVRPEHAALDGKVFSKIDPMARRYFPPLGFNCRCHLEAVPFGETPSKVTNGAEIPDLLDPDGRKIGPPPKGWDTDRVDSLLESFKLTKMGKPPAVVAPAEPPPPPKPIYGEPGWEAPNGLTQETVSNAYLWNPKVQTATLLPDGTVRLKYHSSPAKIDVAPDKAQASVALALKKKAAGPLPPKPAPAPKKPAPAPAPPPPSAPGAMAGGMTEDEINALLVKKNAIVPGSIHSVKIKPSGELLALNEKGEPVGLFATSEVPGVLDVWKSKVAAPPAPPKAPAVLKTKGGLTQADIDAIGSKYYAPGTKVTLNPDGTLSITPSTGSSLVITPDKVDDFMGLLKIEGDMKTGAPLPPSVVKPTPLGHPVTPDAIQKVWGKGGIIEGKGFTVDYDAELLPDGSVKLTKKPGVTKPFSKGLGSADLSPDGLTKTFPPETAADVIDKQFGAAGIAPPGAPPPAKPAPLSPGKKAKAAADAKAAMGKPPSAPPPTDLPPLGDDTAREPEEAGKPPRVVKAPPKLVAKNGMTQDDVDALLAPDGIFAKMFPTTKYSGGTLNPDGSITFTTSVSGGPGTTSATTAKEWAKKHIPGWKPVPVTKSGFTQADVDALVADSKGVWTSGKLKPSGGIDVVHANGKKIPLTADYADGLLKKTFPAGPGSVAAGPGSGAPAKPAKDPLYGLTPITKHLPTPEDYDPTWTNPAGGKRSFGAVVFDEQGRILVREPAGHYDNYHWTFPKGKSNSGESALAAALREVEEETGVKFEALSTVKGSHAGGSGTNHYFLGRASSSTGKLDSETSRIRWVGWDEAEELIKQTTNPKGQKRDLDVLHAAVAEYEKLTGKKPPTFPKVAKPPKPGVVPVALKPPPPAVLAKPVPPGKPTLPTFSGFPDAPEGLKEVRKLGGSTGAVLVEDKQGRRFVMKKGASPDHLREEVYSDAAYHAAGVAVPEFRLYETATGPVKLSKFIEGESLKAVVSKGGKRAADVLSKLREDFAVDAMMGNWDVVGTGMDNVLVDAAGTPWRIDNGGSLRYRAQGGKKAGVEWNDWPTELWTMRGINHAETDATRLFKAAGWKSITDRTAALSARREAILLSVPEDVRRTLAGRIEAMENLHRTSVVMFDDGIVEGHVDAVSRHRVGMGQAGVLAKLPRKLTGGYSSLVDDTGQSFGGLRDGKGSAGAFYDYVKAVASTPADPDLGNKLLASYMSDQAGSSQSANSLRVKGWLMTKRPAAKGAYDGVAKETVLVDAWESYKKGHSADRVAAWEEAFSAQHAFTIELLGRVDVKDNDRTNLTLRLIRTEGASHHVSRRIGGASPIPINPMESTAYAGKQFGGGPGCAVFEWDVPHHRILLSYWQSRWNAWGRTGLYGDSEAEFLAMLNGLPGRRIK